MKLFIFLIYVISMITLTRSWSYAEGISSVLASQLPPNLTDFATAYNNGLNQLIIYGGYSDEGYSNTTYIFNLTDNSVTKIVQNLSDVRYKACILAGPVNLYLFGGYKINSVSKKNEGELWRLDLITFKWSIIKSDLQSYLFCKMNYDSGIILIFGASFDGILDVFAYRIYPSSLQNLTIEFYGSCQYNVTQWDGSIIQQTIPIQDCPSISNSTILISPSFPTTQVTYIDLMDTGTSTKHLIQTQQHIYSYTFTPSNNTLTIRFFNNVDKQYGNIKSKSIKFNSTWNIFCNWNINQKIFYVTFVQKFLISRLRVTKDTPNFYSKNWPDFTGSLDNFCLILLQSNTPPSNNTVPPSINTPSNKIIPPNMTVPLGSNIPTTPSSYPYISIMILIHGTLKVYLLHQNIFINTSAPVGLKGTIFGLNQCLPGWTGSNCTVPACPNSLLINANNGIAVIRLQCSGHGTCTASGCQCDSLWSGTDCSTYDRNSCNGTLLNNFPLKNCQCFDSIIGGNDCSVNFCPGDCFGHGKCNNSVCSCDPGFYGADCSVMVIGFPK